MKRIFHYIQGTKGNGLVFNPPKKLVVDSYGDADFAGLWGHKNPQDPICDRSRTVFVVSVSNCPLSWLSNYRQRLLFLHLIMSIWHFLILLEHYYS